VTQRAASLNLTSKGGWTALHISCQYDAPATVHCLLDNGARSDVKLDDGTTPLYVAAINGQDDVIVALQPRRVEPRQERGEWDKGIHQAIRHN